MHHSPTPALSANRMRRALCSAALCAGAGAGLAAGPASAASYTLSVVSIPGVTAVPTVSGIAPNGRYFGTYSNGDGHIHGFTMLGTTATSFDLGTTTTATLRANSSGDIVGSEVSSGGSYLFKVKNGHFSTNFHLQPPYIVALKDNGDWLGRNIATRTGHFYGLRHITGQGSKPLYAPGSGGTVVTGMNAAGTVIGYTDGSRKTPWISFAYANGVYAPVLAPGGLHTTLEGINDQGTLVLQSIDGTNNPPSYIDANGSFTEIAVPNAVNTNPFGINNEGAVYGNFKASDGVLHGFVFKAGQYTQFDALAGATLNYLYGMDDAGDVVGLEVRNGVVESFLARCSGQGC